MIYTYVAKVYSMGVSQRSVTFEASKTDDHVKIARKLLGWQAEVVGVRLQHSKPRSANPPS